MNKNFKGRIGEKYVNTQGLVVEIIKYFGALNCTIKFEDGSIQNNKSYSCIKRGEVKSLFHISVYGAGYLGEGDYKVTENGKSNLVGETWRSMIKRCHDIRFQEKHPTYIGCSVAKEWFNFQNFAKWHEENYNPKTMKGWQLDKDILIKGNKIYSTETCCFVPREINNLFTKSEKTRGEYPIGVLFIKKREKFTTVLSISNVRKGSGYCNTPEEAFEIYKTAKEKYIKEVTEKWKEQITEQTYQALINYKVEITD